MLSELFSRALTRTYGKRLQRVSDISDLLSCPILVCMHAADGTVTTMWVNSETLEDLGREMPHLCLLVFKQSNGSQIHH